MIFDSVEAYELALRNAVGDAISGSSSLVDAAKSEIQISLAGTVYNSYSPKFVSRRQEAGGLIDKANMITSSSSSGNTYTLEITMAAGWQNLGWYPTNHKGTYGDLSDVIEKNKMYSAPPRPFVSTAEQDIKTQIEAELPSYLIGRGL